jgi:hypothetical protein
VDIIHHESVNTERRITLTACNPDSVTGHERFAGFFNTSGLEQDVRQLAENVRYARL